MRARPSLSQLEIGDGAGSDTGTDSEAGKLAAFPVDEPASGSLSAAHEHGCVPLPERTYRPGSSCSQSARWKGQFN